MADRTEIIDALEGLSVHCRMPIMSVDAKSRWLADWCTDLKPFDGDAIRLAVTRWRQSENVKFPTPGQLMPMVRQASKRPDERAGEQAPKIWSWPSEQELLSMSLTERRRSYRIMAHETCTKAGPMDREGNRPRPQWIAQADAYEEEAKHCGELIARGAQRRLDAAE